MDGTFKAAPELFYQLYTFSFLEEGSCFAALYCLTPSKQRKAYARLLNTVKQLVGPEANVKLGIVDFELAHINALNRAFPTVPLLGCHFHFGQAVWRRVQQMPVIREKYVSDPAHSAQIRRVVALSFVPEEKVRQYYELLKESSFFIAHRGELSEFLRYFEHTLLGWRTPDGKEHSPKFAAALWNSYAFQRENLPLTNNAVEGWHRGFHSLLQADHPSIWKLIEAFRKSEAMNELRRLQLSAGMKFRKKRKHYKNRHKRLSKIVDRFPRIAPLDYLRAIAWMPLR